MSVGPASMIPDDEGNLPTPECVLDEARFYDGDFIGYAVMCVADHATAGSPGECRYNREMFRKRR